MTPEELCDTWDELDTDERLHALGEMGNDTLGLNDYYPVGFHDGDLGGDAGTTDVASGNITLDRGRVDTGDACDAMNTVFHELWHAMELQDHALDVLAPDQREAYNETTIANGYWNDQDEAHMNYEYVVVAHDFAEIFAEHMSDAACDCSGDGSDEAPPAPDTESAGNDDGITFNWSEAVVSDGGWGDGVDPDFEHTVVTNAPAGETGGETEYYEGGRAVPSP